MKTIRAKNITVNEDTQFAVLGLGKFGRSVVKTLYDNGFNVLCCDIDEHAVQAITPYTTYAYQADASEKATLEKLGIRNFDVVVIAFGTNFEGGAVTAITLKEMGVPYILAKAGGLRQKQIFESIGVDRVVLPEEEMGERIAYSFITNHSLEDIRHCGKYDILEMKPEAQWVGKNLKTLRLKQSEGFNIIAIFRSGEVLAMIDGETTLFKDDTLLVLKPRDI